MSKHSGIERQKFIDKNTLLFSANIKRSQRRLFKQLLEEIFSKLETSDGRIVNSTANFTIIGKLDKLYESFIQTDGVNLMADFVKRSDGLFNLNEKYFNNFSSLTPDAFAEVVKQTRETVFSQMGVNVSTGELVKTGGLSRIISDFSPINSMKAELFSAVSNNLLATVVRNKIQVITVGDKDSNGSLENHINRTMNSPLEQFDRSTGVNMSLGLKMNFAQYQGGLIETSRDFCIVRNRKVFSREEIGRFGTPQDEFEGYTNKSAGEFQGKITPGYDPFTMLGGYRCLHILSWISDELAYRLRPELRPVVTTVQ